jgi:tRNA-intron endonuclease
MKPASGDLIENYVILKNNKDIGRIFNKSQFGKTIKGNKLKLDLLEVAFLLNEKKLDIYQNKKPVSLNQIISRAAKNDSEFETNYIIFQDIRKRGIQLQLLNKNDDFTFKYIKNEEKVDNQYFVKVCSEQKTITLTQVKNIIDKISNENNIVFSITDEEGDATHYKIEIITPKGGNKLFKYKKTKGLLLSDRVILFEKKIYDELHLNEFFGKPYANDLQISLVEALYLSEKKLIDIIDIESGKILSNKQVKEKLIINQSDIEKRYFVFKNLKENGLIVKTGFKFGTHFRAYKKSAFKTHAEYLVHAVNEKYMIKWPELSRAIRLAHAVNKIFVFAYVKNQRNITYFSITRLRP